ncbi:protein crumbs homolog 1-like isoform X2 [Mercenaria mercenaria]|uniref:protein crumbs homolog 1-like isoform X2 n=1 Tax=Mercenaria mercenaria TaxID=6596 RepID=UPI00234E7B0C|nr:protein crumbs homolog 1-like isoform X2 [Mercenaria mercenaria]
MFSLGTKKVISFISIAATLLLRVQLTESSPSHETSQNLQDTQTNTTSSDGDACSSNPCLHGTCFGNGTEYHCFCLSGFTGTNCETTINACKSNPCERGVCYHYHKQFRCVCPPGYSGKLCEIDINECFSQPCLNGGICNDEIAGFSCNCSSGFTGDHCGTDIDECSSSPCLNGGVCKDGINRYVCQCSTGYGGDICQKVTNPCKYNPCVRGTCFAHLSQFICECPSRYTGKLCDTSIQLMLNGPKEMFITLQAGNMLNLQCSVSMPDNRYYSYRASFEWSKRRHCGGSFSSHSRSSSYQKSDAHIGDAGTYMCIASYRYEPSVMKVFHVDIPWQSETCNFDDGSLCGWTDYGSSISWSLQYGRTQSIDREQRNDHTLGTSDGGYMQVDATSQRDDDRTALLTSHDFPAGRTVCFEFWYRISGEGQGRLSVNLKDKCLSKETELLKFTEDQGRKWNKATVTVLQTFVPNDYNIILKADIRRSFNGTMAIDDVKISKGNCLD